MALGNNVRWKSMPGRYQETTADGQLATFTDDKGKVRPVWAKDSAIADKPSKKDALKLYIDLWESHKALLATGDDSPFAMKGIVSKLGNHYSVSSIKSLVSDSMKKIGIEVKEFLPTNPGGKRGLTSKDILTVVSQEKAEQLFLL
jgi:hypothetical protein